MKTPLTKRIEYVTDHFSIKAQWKDQIHIAHRTFTQAVSPEEAQALIEALAEAIGDAEKL